MIKQEKVPTEYTIMDKEKILDKALMLAEDSSWESLRLYEVARSLDIDLNTVNQHFQQKDDITEALFDRADQAMLCVPEKSYFTHLSIRERFQKLIQTWLDTLEPYRASVRDMINYKMELGHVHLQGASITRISRTVQWILEASHLDTHGIRRIAEESVLSSILVSTFIVWIRNVKLAKSHLEFSLINAEKMAKWIP